MISSPAFAAALAAALVATAARAGPIEAVCEQTDSAAVCDCATEKLQAGADAEALAIYRAVLAAYLPRLEAGAEPGKALEAGLVEVAKQRSISVTALVQRTNEAGTVHRAAIEACRG